MSQFQPTKSATYHENVTISIGSNMSGHVGTPMQTLAHSLKLFAGESLNLVRQSHWYRTAAFPAGSGPDYVNAVIQVETALSATQILMALHRIEADAGRLRTTRWAARTCDLDLLCVGQLIAPDLVEFDRWRGLTLDQQKTKVPAQLILPHPRLQDRAFVLVPFADIAPDWQHPVLRKSVGEMLKSLPQSELAKIHRITSD